MTPRALLALALTALAFACAAPARAQWTRVEAVPIEAVYTVFSQGDTIVAGTDTVAYVSTDAGAHWRTTARIGTAMWTVQAVALTHGRLYVGRYGDGVWASDDLGVTWMPYSGGLVGGIFDSQLSITAFAERAGTLYAATDGAGVYALDLAAGLPWSAFHHQDLIDVANESMNGIAAGGGRLLAGGGANGVLARNEGPLSGWAEDFLDNVGLEPGLSTAGVTKLPSAWLVATTAGFFRSPDGRMPWTYIGPVDGYLSTLTVATEPGRAVAAFLRPNVTIFRQSLDDGATWTPIETNTSFTLDVALTPGVLWAARADGLWRRPLDPVTGVRAVPDRALALRYASPQPARGEARVRFALAAPSAATLELFDVQGRRVATALDEVLAAGEHEVALPLRGLAAGVYLARLRAEGRDETLRVVRLD